jgi:CheY-like chemotaxis protein
MSLESPRGHERILLVEDEGALRVGTARLLEDAGYKVVVAVDGVDALEIVDANSTAFDLVLTDVAMPRMRGDELALQLKFRAGDPPVIFMSGYNSGATALPGRVLAKPVLETHLLHAVREELDG